MPQELYLRVINWLKKSEPIQRFIDLSLNNLETIFYRKDSMNNEYLCLKDKNSGTHLFAYTTDIFKEETKIYVIKTIDEIEELREEIFDNNIYLPFIYTNNEIPFWEMMNEV